MEIIINNIYSKDLQDYVVNNIEELQAIYTKETKDNPSYMYDIKLISEDIQISFENFIVTFLRHGYTLEMDGYNLLINL